MDQLRVGVIGTGAMGQQHCRVYSNMRRVQLVGICDTRPEVGNRIAQQYEVPFYDRVDDLLKEVDAVSLVVPTPYHFELAMHCLAREVHVLVEKPITETVAQAEILTQAAEASNRVVLVGHIERFNPTYSELKNVLDDVTPLVINLRRLSPYQSSNKDVDVILDLMIHDLDLVLDLMQREPSSINAYGLIAFSGTIDHAIAQLGFEAGPLVTVTASRVTEQKVRQLEVTAMEAYLEGDLLNKSILVHRRTFGEYLNNHKYRQESIVESIHVPTVEPLFLELQHFVECILKDKSPRTSSRDGYRALCLAQTVSDAVHKNMVDANIFTRPKLIKN